MATSIKQDKYGNPIGVSSNAMKKGTYAISPTGDYKYVGKTGESITTAPTRRIFSSDGNATSERRAADDLAKRTAKYNYDVGQQNLLRDSNVAQVNWNAMEANKKNTIPGYVPQAYSESDAYRENRAAAQNAMGAFSTTMANLQLEQEAARKKEQDAKRAQILAQQEVRNRITSADSEMARNDILNNRLQELRRQNPTLSESELQAKLDRTFQPLNRDYLSSLDMVDESGKNIYGLGTTNFDIDTGFKNSAQDIADFRNYTQPLRDSKQNPANAGFSVNALRDAFLANQVNNAQLDTGLDRAVNAGPDTMMFQGQMYASDGNGNWYPAPYTDNSNDISLSGNTANSVTGGSTQKPLDTTAYGSQEDLANAILQALGIVKNATGAYSEQTPATQITNTPIVGNGAQYSGVGYSPAMYSGSPQSQSPRTSTVKASVLNKPKVKLNPIQYA